MGSVELQRAGPTLSISDVTKLEGDAGTKVFAFTVTLSAPASSPVTVRFATANGLAISPSDYRGIRGTLTFAPGQTSRTVKVMVRGDTQPEGNETFTVNLSKPSGATIADGTGVGTILNDD